MLKYDARCDIMLYEKLVHKCFRRGALNVSKKHRKKLFILRIRRKT